LHEEDEPDEDRMDVDGDVDGYGDSVSPNDDDDNQLERNAVDEDGKGEKGEEVAWEAVALIKCKIIFSKKPVPITVSQSHNA
jgi:hypothetical protein